MPVLAVPLGGTPLVRFDLEGPVFRVERFVAAVDFREATLPLARLAADVAREFHASLLLAHVVQPVQAPERWHASRDAATALHVATAREGLADLVSRIDDAVDVDMDGPRRARARRDRGPRRRPRRRRHRDRDGHGTSGVASTGVDGLSRARPVGAPGAGDPSGSCRACRCERASRRESCARLAEYAAARVPGEEAQADFRPFQPALGGVAPTATPYNTQSCSLPRRLARAAVFNNLDRPRAAGNLQDHAQTPRRAPGSAAAPPNLLTHRSRPRHATCARDRCALGSDPRCSPSPAARPASSRACSSCCSRSAPRSPSPPTTTRVTMRATRAT